MLDCWINEKWYSTRWRATKWYVISTLLYSMEGWILKTKTLFRLDAFEMWFYRNNLKISWVERAGNIEGLRRMKKEEEWLITFKRENQHILDTHFGTINTIFFDSLRNVKWRGRRGVDRKDMSWLRNLKMRQH